MLAEANYLVKQAVRKLNHDNDITTAQILLVSANTNLAELNDPSLNNIRALITKDIATLAAIKRVDFDGIIIRLEQLSEQVATLSIPKKIEFDKDGIMLESEQENMELSDSVSDWKQNLAKSWKGFTTGFISVQKINPNADSSKPELSANQFAYLRENIRMQLLISAQAASNQQPLVYNQTLTKALAWTKAYYDTDATDVASFISELEALMAMPVKEEIPTALSSQSPLEHVVRTQVRDLLGKLPADVAKGE